MVRPTCKQPLCRKRANIDEAGNCPEHNNSDEISAAGDEVHCGKCKEIVPNDSSTKALCCDSDECRVWFHLNCTKALYVLINDNSEHDTDIGIRRLCPSCCIENAVIKVSVPSTKPVCNRLKHGTCPWYYWEVHTQR